MVFIHPMPWPRDRDRNRGGKTFRGVDSHFVWEMEELGSPPHISDWLPSKVIETGYQVLVTTIWCGVADLGIIWIKQLAIFCESWSWCFSLWRSFQSGSKRQQIISDPPCSAPSFWGVPCQTSELLLSLYSPKLVCPILVATNTRFLQSLSPCTQTSQLRCYMQGG